MSLILCAAAVSDRGLVRTNNEDSAFAGQRLIAVADGIGGLPAGEVASDIAIRALAPLESAADLDEPLVGLRNAADTANRRIRAAAEADPASNGMGTTLTALLLTVDDSGGGQLGLLHIGDSRCYLRRDGVLTQVTRDDTYVQSLVDQGVLTAQEARRHPRRSLVTKAMHGDHLAPTCELVETRPGDRFLVCSDGLSDYVTDEAIARVLQLPLEPPECGERLVELALDAGAPDNVTVVVADVLDTP